MEPVISVFFDSDRTYIALLEPDAKGWSLAYINSTTQPIDLALGSEGSAVQELESVMAEIAGAASSVHVTLPMESVFVHQFPAPLTDSVDEIRELVRFEISQHFPHQDAEGFSSTVYTMSPRLDRTSMMMAVIMEQNMLGTVRSVLAPLMADIARIDTAQMAAHNALSYNYPDNDGASFLVCGVQERYVDVSVIRKGSMAYYHLVPLSENSIGAVCEEELNRVLDEYVPFVDGAFFFGSGLTRERYESAASSISLPAHRLNAFRMLTTTLGERERAYCSRVGHIFPACIGNIFPDLQHGLSV